MTRVLIVSVGGSPDPILKAVELHQPDEVIFACSAPPCEEPSLNQVIGEGIPCKHRVAGEDHWRPNLVTQLGLRQFRQDLQLIHLPDPDDLNDCLQRLRAFLASLVERFSSLELIGDFTGGTKSMSAAMAIALLDRQASLSFVTGKRDNLIRIEKSEGLRIVDPIPYLAQRLLQQRLPPLLESHLYGRARSLLIDFSQEQRQRLHPDQIHALDTVIIELQVLVLWDRFRWRDALDLAEQYPFRHIWPELWSWWLRVEASIDWDQQEQPAVPITGYELVQDLLLNAERRGRRGWYDDAVARLYRALELLAQTYVRLELGLEGIPDWGNRLKPPRLRSGESVPNHSVVALYRWLQYREAPGGLGGLYGRQWQELLSLFDARNRSLLGHGLRPIEQSEWLALQARVNNLVIKTLQALDIQQGAQPSQLPGLEILRHPVLTQFLVHSSSSIHV
jgi:CRISPR-associated protein (TIGR02710 family)